jgi:hypothetical protein
MLDIIDESEWFNLVDLTDEEMGEIGLDDSELNRIENVLDNPAVSDPVFLLLPVGRRGRGGSR